METLNPESVARELWNQIHEEIYLLTIYSKKDTERIPSYSTIKKILQSMIQKEGEI